MNNVITTEISIKFPNKFDYDDVNTISTQIINYCKVNGILELNIVTKSLYSQENVVSEKLPIISINNNSGEIYYKDDTTAATQQEEPIYEKTALASPDAPVDLDIAHIPFGSNTEEVCSSAPYGHHEFSDGSIASSTNLRPSPGEFIPFDKMTVKNLIMVCLQNNKGSRRGMNIREIFQDVQGRGHTTRSKDPISIIRNNLYTLKRDKLITLKDHKWFAK